MRRILAAATACSISCVASTDPCKGVVPASLDNSVDVGDVLIDPVPFEDAVVGDGKGSIAFVTTLFNFPGTAYAATLYGNDGHFIGGFQAYYVDIDHARPIFQEDGFQILEGNMVSYVRLVTYSSAGSVIRKTPVVPANKMVSAPDSRGGSLVIALRGIPNGVPKLAYPWTLSAQRFDANGSPRTSDTVVAKDIAGDNFVTWIAGTVTTTGWILVVWSSFDSPDPNSAVAQAAWISPSGDVRRAQPFGKNGDRIGVIPLVEGGAAVALTPPGVPAIFEWTAVFKDGSVTPEPAGWLGQFPDTRIALVRNKRAYAVFQSSPYPASTADEPCASTVSLDLMSGAGTECGKLSVPALLEPDAACVGSATSLAVTADGTLVARTIEQSQDVSGATRFHSQARWWPHLLK